MFWLASNKRRAILARKRVIGTRFSARAPKSSGTAGVDGAAGAATAGASTTGVDAKLTTSSFVRRPSFPVAGIAAASSPFSREFLYFEIDEILDFYLISYLIFSPFVNKQFTQTSKFKFLDLFNLLRSHLF